MWRILFAEISNNRIIFFIYLSITIGITFLEKELADGGRFYVAMLLFLIVQNWLSLKTKSRRDLFINKLPLSGLSLGGLRVGMILMSAFLIVLVYKTMHIFLGIQGHANYPVTGWKLINYLSIVLFLFSVYFILNDLLAPRLRELINFELYKERFIQILILLAVILQILGLLAFMTGAPNFLTKVFDVLYFNNPFDDTRNIQIFAVFSLVCAGLSTFTFSRRRNYI